VLFRTHEQRYREPMVKRDLVEAIIGLPKDLFQNNSIPTSILVLNEDKPAEREDEVLFLHAAENHAVDEPFFRDVLNSNQNELTEAGVERIVGNYHNWTTEEKVSRTVSTEEIQRNDYNLNIALYVDTTEPEDDIKVAEELADLRELQQERAEIEARLDQHMEALNYE